MRLGRSWGVEVCGPNCGCGGFLRISRGAGAGAAAHGLRNFGAPDVGAFRFLGRDSARVREGLEAPRNTRNNHKQKDGPLENFAVLKILKNVTSIAVLNVVLGNLILMGLF